MYALLPLSTCEKGAGFRSRWTIAFSASALFRDVTRAIMEERRNLHLLNTKSTDQIDRRTPFPAGYQIDACNPQYKEIFKPGKWKASKEARLGSFVGDSVAAESPPGPRDYMSGGSPPSPPSTSPRPPEKAPRIHMAAMHPVVTALVQPPGTMNGLEDFARTLVCDRFRDRPLPTKPATYHNSHADDQLILLWEEP